MRVLVTIRVLLLTTLVIPCASHAAAQTRPEPSLALETDPEVPHWAMAVTTDPVDPFLGRFGLRIEAAVEPAHAVWVSPAFLAADGAHGLELEIGYHLWVLGDGVSGIFAGPFTSTGIVVGERAEVSGEIGIEAGLQIVWAGIALGVGGGIVARWDDVSRGQRDARARPRVVLAIGHAWM